MEEPTKTPKKSANKDGSWTGFLLENIFGILRSFVEGMFESANQAANAFTRKLARSVFLIFLIFLGVAFLLVGVARILSELYGFSGAGEVIVGASVIFVSLVLYVFVRDDH
jgi:hypothetical protein